MPTDSKAALSLHMIKNISFWSRGKLTEAVLASFFLNLLGLAIPVFMLQVYDRVVFHGGLSTLKGLVIGIALVLLFEVILRFGRSRIFQKIGLDIDIELGRTLFQQIMAMPLRRLEQRDGTFWHLIFRDLEVVRSTFSGSVLVMMLDLPFSLIFFVTIWVLAPELAFVLFVALVAFIILAFISGKVLSSLSFKEKQNSENRERLLAELITGRSTLKALALANTVMPKWEARHARSIQSSITRGMTSDGYQIISQVTAMATTVALTTTGALLILEQNMTIGALIASNMLAVKLVAPIVGMVSQWKQIQLAYSAIARLVSFLAEPTEKMSGGLPFERPDGQIRLENLCFSYGDRHPRAINDISGIIGPGGLHCLVGNNGCGKTTLLKILAGLYPPDQGRVLISGADLGQFSRQQIADWIAYMPQEVFLFSGTIKDNIAFGAFEAPSQDIIKSSEIVGLHETVADLPDGYDTDVGEMGCHMSAGQRRRISAARTLMGLPPILLLDEPTSDMDQQAEKQFIAGLKSLSQNHTIVMATHSAKILEQADAILVLDRGSVVMVGSAKSVMERLGHESSDAAKEPPRPINKITQATATKIAKTAGDVP